MLVIQNTKTLEAFKNLILFSGARITTANPCRKMRYYRSIPWLLLNLTVRMSSVSPGKHFFTHRTQMINGLDLDQIILHPIKDEVPVGLLTTQEPWSTD